MEALDTWVARLAAGRVRSTVAGGNPAWMTWLPPTRLAQEADDRRRISASVQFSRTAVRDTFYARPYMESRGASPLPSISLGTHDNRIAALLAANAAEELLLYALHLEARHLARLAAGEASYLEGPIELALNAAVLAEEATRRPAG